LKKGNRIKLSKQQLVDCSPNNGCSGGYLRVTFNYVKEQGGLEPAAFYPYAGVRRTGALKPAKVGAIKSYGKILPWKEEAMKLALSIYGPLAAAVYVGKDLQFYAASKNRRESDILDIASCPKQINHAIAIVGYGTEHGKDYWCM
jgi:histolysain